jgi:hypothetical protein
LEPNFLPFEKHLIDTSEMQDLEEKVRASLEAIRRVRESQVGFEHIEANKSSRRELLGPINYLFLNIGLWFGLKAVKHTQRKRTEAKELLSQEEIKESLCTTLADLSNNSQPDDHLIVASVVRTLTSTSVMKKYDIRIDDELFGVCCDEILLTGLDNFCTDCSAVNKT